MKPGFKTTEFLLLVGCLIALLAGCGTEGYVRAESIQPAVDLVTQMHDRLLMMELDPKTIKPKDRATYLRTSRLLRETVREASAQTD